MEFTVRKGYGMISRDRLRVKFGVKIMSALQRFVSHDGEGYEVYVQTGRGVIVSLVPSKTGATANIKIDVPSFEYPVNGWVQTEDPIYPKVQEAFERKEEISYRMESNRNKSALSKADMPLDTPIAELRKDTDTAKKFTVTVLAALNGERTQEAVTNPSKDPAPLGKPVPDIDDNSNQPKQERQRRNAPTPPNPASRNMTEEPPFRLYNSNGALNLASYLVAGFIGAENIAREMVNEQIADDNLELDEEGHERVENYIFALTEHILQIADNVQICVPQMWNRIDRQAGSHSKARSVVYDTVKTIPIPSLENITVDEINEWKNAVYAKAAARFNRIVRMAMNYLHPPQQAPQAQQPQQRSQSQQPTPTHQGGAQQQTAAPQAPPVAIFKYENRGKDSGDKRASEETKSMIWDLIQEYNITENSPQAQQIDMLLGLTFNEQDLNKISDNGLQDFIDFYVANGEENFKAALGLAEKHWRANNQ